MKLPSYARPFDGWDLSTSLFLDLSPLSWLSILVLTPIMPGPMLPSWSLSALLLGEFAEVDSVPVVKIVIMSYSLWGAVYF